MYIHSAAKRGDCRLSGFRADLDPKEPTFLRDLYKEIIIRSPKRLKGRFFGVQGGFKGFEGPRFDGPGGAAAQVLGV